MKNKKGFITAGVVISAFVLGVIALTWRGPTDGLDIVAILLFLFCAWYGTLKNFGKV